MCPNWPGVCVDATARSRCTATWFRRCNSWYDGARRLVVEFISHRHGAVMDAEAEKITIIEGPTPVFEQTPETWLPSLSEGPTLPDLALTRLRTLNGPAMVERCWKAWD